MNKRFYIFLAIFVVLYIIISNIAGFYVDYEWFSINKATSIFWVLFSAKFIVHFIFALLFILFFTLNFLLIWFLGGKGRIFTSHILSKLQLPILGSPRRALFLLMIGGVLFFSFIMGGYASSYWKEYLMFSNAVPFTGFQPDPVFLKDIGFYVFSLPFYDFLYHWLITTFIILIIFSVIFHIMNGGILFNNNRVEFSLFARAHISTLLALFVLVYGIGYRLSAYELLFSKIGKFYGAGYTAVHAQLYAYNIAMFIAFIASILFIINIFKKSFKMPLIVLATLLPVFFILNTIFPAIQQRFVVVPDEFNKEKKYINHNIAFTRTAYGISKIKSKEFANNTNLRYNDIKKNKNVFENIRLWDWRPLRQTYKQLQELKRYYNFRDVDIDRYIINGEKIAVNLSARELSVFEMGVESRTWQNKHLMYTHGYGLVMSRVDKVTKEGLPEILIADFPPKSKIDLSVDRPEIYYGEHHNPYIITNTTTQEFDYPSGSGNKYTTYKGTGGSQLNSFFKRLMFAVAFKDINILISSNINNKSRVHYRRNIMRMLTELTPFLDFDGDPYLVLSGGKLYWVIDAYTTTDKFPYSTPTILRRKKINYIRNSVKITIDAYNGTVNYYIADPEDPIIKTYSHIFKGIFKDISKMPDELKKHIRYPEYYFNIQVNTLLRYHMTDPTVFYNNEDMWQIPTQIYESAKENVQSYYFVTRLPGEERSEFILYMPFTPYKKDNMIAFLAAKCDMPNYGELTLYTLPKEKLSYGHMQIEARINQDPEISKLLTLWSQKGSSVIRGNMLAIPVEESIIYIEPLYLKAESSEMPQLKRIIVSYADEIVMEKDLPSALEKLFFSESFKDMRNDLISKKQMDIKSLAIKAYSHYTKAESYMRTGNWSKYGEELKNLKEILKMMKSLNK